MHTLDFFRKQPFRIFTCFILAAVIMVCGVGIKPITIHAAELTLGETISFEGASVPSGWYAGYGGSLSVSSDCAHTGNHSLKLSGRTEAWHSPAFNIYPTIKSNGAGRYRIGMWVRTNAVASTGKESRILIRGTKLNSFITLHNTNYFYAIMSPTTLTPNTWQYFSGTVDVLASDISSASGQFNLMLDLLNPVEGQNLYIDDVCIEKLNVRVQSVQFEQSTYHYSVNFNRIGVENYVYAHVYPEFADNQEVRYYSSNTDIATVNTLTGQIVTKKPGEVTITAYSVEDPNKKVTCKVMVQYQLYLYHYYDNGFSTRYPNDNVVYGINQNQAFVADIFDDLLDLRISGTVNYFASTADTCKGTVTSANLDSMCSHTPCCSDATHMHSKFYAAHHINSNTAASILWSGHRTIWEDDINRSFTMIYTNGSRDMMMLANKTTISENRSTLLHETAHLIGAPDHYHETDSKTGECKNKEYCSQCGDDPRPYACTMEASDFYTTSAFNGTDYFCSECVEDMRAHVREHH